MLNRISLRQMEYLVATAKHGSIAAASAQTTPSAAVHLGGHRLTSRPERCNCSCGILRGPALTPMGMQVMQECEDSLERATKLYEIAQLHRRHPGRAARGPLSPAAVAGHDCARSHLWFLACVRKRSSCIWPRATSKSSSTKLHTLDIDVALTYDFAVGRRDQFETLAHMPACVGR